MCALGNKRTNCRVRSVLICVGDEGIGASGTVQVVIVILLLLLLLLLMMMMMMMMMMMVMLVMMMAICLLPFVCYLSKFIVPWLCLQQLNCLGVATHRLLRWAWRSAAHVTLDDIGIKIPDFMDPSATNSRLSSGSHCQGVRHGSSRRCLAWSDTDLAATKWSWFFHVFPTNLKGWSIVRVKIRVKVLFGPIHTHYQYHLHLLFSTRLQHSSFGDIYLELWCWYRYSCSSMDTDGYCIRTYQMGKLWNASTPFSNLPTPFLVQSSILRIS